MTVDLRTARGYMVTLPSSPGTSGFPVVDLNGNLVGIIVNGAT